MFFPGRGLAHFFVAGAYLYFFWRLLFCAATLACCGASKRKLTCQATAKQYGEVISDDARPQEHWTRCCVCPEMCVLTCHFQGHGTACAVTAQDHLPSSHLRFERFRAQGGPRRYRPSTLAAVKGSAWFAGLDDICFAGWEVDGSVWQAEKFFRYLSNRLSAHPQITIAEQVLSAKVFFCCGSQLRFFPGRGLSLICSSQGPHIATFIHDKQTNKIYREERVSQESPPTKTRINKKLESTNNRATTTPTHHSVFAPPPRHALTIQCLGSSTTATGAGGRCPER